MKKIPRCMSTQHPDNVHSPFFVGNTELGGEDEILEAFYAFSILGCDEQMWDCEGKEVDNLQRLHRLSNDIGVAIYPIVGVGSAPFRGNLKPTTVERVAEEYQGTHTFIIQSAFKYDYPSDEVRDAIRKLQDREIGPPQEVDEERCLEIIKKYSEEYTRQVAELAPVINEVAGYVPSRRKRKLHIGLFGYSREVGGISLPRAIPFTSALYSIGLPPEILGLSALSNEDMRFVREVYVHFEDDLGDALRYLNPSTPFLSKLPKGLEAVVRNFPTKTDIGHKELTNHIWVS